MTSPPDASRRRSSGVARARRRPPAISATRSHDSASLMYWVVTSIVRPVARNRWSSSQTLARSSGSMPGGRLVEEQQGGIVDERARELEPALHAAGQAPGSPAADVPQVEQLEDLAGPASAAREHHPEQRPHEVDVLADRQIRVERERLGHVAEPLAGLAPEPARLLAQHPDRARCRGQGTREKPDRRRLARPRRSDQAEDRPRRHDQRDTVHGELVVEPHRDVVDDDRGVGLRLGRVGRGPALGRRRGGLVRAGRREAGPVVGWGRGKHWDSRS